jgi:hypothetical protein
MEREIMSSLSELGITAATIVISSVLLYLLARIGRRALGSGLDVQICVGEQATAVSAKGAVLFQASSRLRYTRVRNGRPRIIHFVEDDVAKQASEGDIREYDLADVHQGPEPGVVDAFIVGCCWRAREGVGAGECLGGMNVLVVLDLTEGRRTQLLREIHPGEIERGAAVRLTVQHERRRLS